MKRIALSLLIFLAYQPRHAEKGFVTTSVETTWHLVKIGTGLFIGIGVGMPMVFMGLGTGTIILIPALNQQDHNTKTFFVGTSAASCIIGSGLSYGSYRLTKSGLNGLKELYGDTKKAINSLDEIVKDL